MDPSHYLILAKWTDEFLSFENFPNLIYDKNGAPVLSILIETLSSLDLQDICDLFIKKCLNWSKKNNYYFKSNQIQYFVQDLFYGHSTSYLMEKICLFVSGKMASSLFQTFFQPNLKNLSINKYSNYSVQKIILRLTNKNDVQQAFNILFPYFDSIIKTYKGVIWALITACSYFTLNYKKILKLIMKNLNIKRKKNLFLGLINNRKKNLYPYLDCLIFLTLLKFRVYEITDIFVGLFYLPIKEFTSNPILSRIFDAGIKSFSKVTIRKKFVKRLFRDLDSIVDSEYGSYCVENSFWISDLKIKKIIAQRLLFRYNRHSGNKFASRVIANLRLNRFRLDLEIWEKIILTYIKFKKNINRRIKTL